MTIYKEMCAVERNKIIEERCQNYGITVNYDASGNAGYIPDFTDVTQFYDNCKNPRLKEEIRKKLLSSIGEFKGDDTWKDIS